MSRKNNNDLLPPYEQNIDYMYRHGEYRCPEGQVYDRLRTDCYDEDDEILNRTLPFQRLGDTFYPRVYTENKSQYDNMMKNAKANRAERLAKEAQGGTMTPKSKMRAPLRQGQNYEHDPIDGDSRNMRPLRRSFDNIQVHPRSPRQVQQVQPTRRQSPPRANPYLQRPEPIQVQPSRVERSQPRDSIRSSDPRVNRLSDDLKHVCSIQQHPRKTIEIVRQLLYRFDSDTSSTATPMQPRPSTQSAHASRSAVPRPSTQSTQIGASILPVQADSAVIDTLFGTSDPTAIGEKVTSAVSSTTSAISSVVNSGRNALSDAVSAVGSAFGASRPPSPSASRPPSPSASRVGTANVSRPSSANVSPTNSQIGSSMEDLFASLGNRHQSSGSARSAQRDRTAGSDVGSVYGSL
jgi:hypothetical protein